MRCARSSSLSAGSMLGTSTPTSSTPSAKNASTHSGDSARKSLLHTGGCDRRVFISTLLGNALPPISALTAAMVCGRTSSLGAASGSSSVRSMTRQGPTNRSSGSDAASPVPGKRCAGASTCAPQCAEKLTAETSAGSPAATEAVNRTTNGGSPG